MTGDEEKFTPSFGNMDMGQIEGAAKAAKNMADRRFTKFEGDIQVVIELGMFDKDNYQLVKDLKKDVEENIVKYEEILTHLEGVYSVKPDKFKEQLKELTGNFEVMAARRSTVRTKAEKQSKPLRRRKTNRSRKVQGRTEH